MTAQSRAIALFRQTYDRAPDFVAVAPGRVNLMGDHTDYNDGLVLPMAINLEVAIAAGGVAGRIVEARSESRGSPAGFDLDDLIKGDGWGEYLKGVASALGPERLVGWQGTVASDIPDGAGLSSSAALEMAVARVFAETSSIVWDPVAMAIAGQRAENEWIGLNSGIMDQLISATGRSGHARLIDCRSLDATDVPLITDCAVVILDTGTRRSLVTSAYNDRRVSCEEAAASLGIGSLRDATHEMLADTVMDPVSYRRARHVITENARTAACADALSIGDGPLVGRLMNESHASLRDDFEVSSPALDAMATVAREIPGCHGARQTGGGFAGSCVALVETASLHSFLTDVTRGYELRTGITPTAHVVDAADGASVKTL